MGAAVEVPKPIVVEDRDVILKVTGSTICGSDLHLLHGTSTFCSYPVSVTHSLPGTVLEMEKGDILGHEFCGIIDDMGPAAAASSKGLKKGDRVVASFQIACGDVSAFRLVSP